MLRGEGNPVRDIVLTAFILGLVPWILTRPYIGVLAWAWLSYMNPHRMTWGFAYSMPFAQIVAVTLLLSLLFTKEKLRVPVNGLTVTWFLYLAWMVVTTMFAIYPDDAWFRLGEVMKIQLFIFITIMVMTTRQRVDALVWVIVISIGYFSVKGGIFTLQTGGQYHVWGPPMTMIADNNHLATASLMILPLMLYLARQTRHKWLKWVLLGSALSTAFSIIGSQSRGAFVAGAAVAAFLVLRSKHKFVGLVGITGAVVLLLAFAPESWHMRMETIRDYEEDQSAMGRLNAWGYAINVANSRLTGAGFDSWTNETFAIWAPHSPYGRAAHSIYFGVLGEHGWVGLVLFVTILLAAWRRATWVRRQVRGSEELQWLGDLMLMVQVSMVAYMTGGAFLSLAYYDLAWHLIAIVIIAGEMIRQNNLARSRTRDRGLDTVRGY